MLNFFKVEQQGKVGIVTINRPDAGNAFNETLHKQLETIFRELAYDDAIEAIILTGAGKVFSLGGDIKMMEKGNMVRDIPLEEAINIIVNLLRIVKPTIAAINGHAIGLGASIALFCDIVIASEEAKIGDPHVKMGLVAGDGGCVIWPLLIGVNRAKEMLMTGELLSAKRAESIGLINYCVPQRQVMTKALEIAHNLANGPVKAVQWTKMSLNKRLLEQVVSVLPTSTALEWLSMHTEDHREAVNAFLMKRDPKFKGK